LDGNKAYFEVPSLYDWIWIEIYLRWRCEAAGIYKIRLGRECSGLEEYFHMFPQSGIMHDLMVEKEADISALNTL
jgi:hypothetical protein